MDVLKPPTVWIDGACYRKNPGDVDDGLEGAEAGLTGDTVDEYGEDAGILDETVPEGEEDKRGCPEIRSIDGGTRFQMDFPVASAFFALLIGKKGTTKKRIEGETKTRISIPKQGTEGNVVISGSSTGSVRAAWSRMQVIVESARDRHEFTHFVSVPMNSSEMVRAFEAFRTECLDKFDGHQRGVDASVFQDPGLLHLTIGTMALMDDRERHAAVSLLEKFREEVAPSLLGRGPLRVRVAGLEIMNDDPGDVNVVYAKVRTANQEEGGTDVLQELADRLVDKFVSGGLMTRQYDRVKLHLTLMNSLFRTDTRAGIFDNEVAAKKNVPARDDEGPRAARETMDAREILSQFGDHDFVQEMEVKELHLSQRRAGRRTKEGYYWPSGKVSL